MTCTCYDNSGPCSVCDGETEHLTIAEIRARFEKEETDAGKK